MTEEITYWGAVLYGVIIVAIGFLMAGIIIGTERLGEFVARKTGKKFLRAAIPLGVVALIGVFVVPALLMWIFSL